MNINPEIIKVLDQYNINEDSGLLCLLSIYHNISDSFFNSEYESVFKQINFTKIVERNYQDEGKVIWNIPLYVSESIVDAAWIWIENFRQLFGNVRADAIGSKKGCYLKMKKFFANNPDVRKEDVMKAATMYIEKFKRSMKNPADVKYLQQADYFISKVVKAEGGTQYNSRLEMFLELMKKEQSEQLKGESATVHRANSQLM